MTNRSMGGLSLSLKEIPRQNAFVEILIEELQNRESLGRIKDQLSLDNDVVSIKVHSGLHIS